jgi:hypothetical protein
MNRGAISDVDIAGGVNGARPHLSVEVGAISSDSFTGGAIKRGAGIQAVEVGAEFGVSANPVRGALRRLRVQGLVEVVPRLGARVPQLDPASYREAVEIRRHLESLAGR